MRTLGRMVGSAALAALGAVAVAGPPSPGPSAAGGGDRGGHEIEHETARLRAELALAEGVDFYLRLDARGRRLALVLKGVPLEEQALDSVEIGYPRVAFRKRPPAAGWDLRSYGGGRLSPDRERDRIVIQAPAPSPTGDEAALEPSPPAIPPTAEESYSVPSRYRIVFDGGVSVEVVAGGGGRNRAWPRRLLDTLRLRIDDLAEVLGDEPADVRLRLRMSAEDAAALYRSLPPSVQLVVLGLAGG